MSADLDLTVAKWIKSSYSDANGGDCLEFTRDFTWIKSSHSDGDGGQCIEFSPAHSATHGVVPVRDSKNPGHPALVFPAAGWSSFVAAVKNGGLPT